MFLKPNIVSFLTRVPCVINYFSCDISRMQFCQTDLDETGVESSELTKLRAAYSHQLEEQVALARLDIVNALQDQIQVASLGCCEV